MDKLAAELGMDPVELRCRNAMEQGASRPTGQVVDSPAPVAELLRRVQAMPLPPERTGRSAGPARPARRRVQHHPRRGRRPRRRLRGRHTRTSASPRASTTTPPPGCGSRCVGGEPVATVHTAAAEVGQGLVTVQQQIARTELGVDQVIVRTQGHRSRQRPGRRRRPGRPTCTGGAVKAACEAVREKVLERARQRSGRPDLAGAAPGRRQGGLGRRRGRRRPGRPARRRGVEETVRVAAPPDRGRSTRRPGRASRTSSTPSPRTARSSTSTPSSAWSRSSSWPAPRTSARRSTRRRSSARSRAAPPRGWALAVMEEIVVTRDGKIRNPSFTDYLIPTILDMPPMRVEVLELADPHAPYGLRGVGEAADHLVRAGRAFPSGRRSGARGRAG